MSLTINQLIKKSKTRNRKDKRKNNKIKMLGGSPHRKGICLKIFTTKPKKPNSAQRKVAKVKLTYNSRVIRASIPGIGYNIQEHSVVLIQGKRIRDLPGIHYRLMRGNLDFHYKEQIKRSKSRSKYGVPKKIN